MINKLSLLYQSVLHMSTIWKLLVGFLFVVHKNDLPVVHVCAVWWRILNELLSVLTEYLFIFFKWKISAWSWELFPLKIYQVGNILQKTKGFQLKSWMIYILFYISDEISPIHHFKSKIWNKTNLKHHTLLCMDHSNVILHCSQNVMIFLPCKKFSLFHWRQSSV